MSKFKEGQAVSTKSQLDATVAYATGVPLETVRAVTSEFIVSVVNELADNHDVRLDGLGTLIIRQSRPIETTLTNTKTQKRVTRFTRKFRVSFRKSVILRNKLHSSAKNDEGIWKSME